MDGCRRKIAPEEAYKYDDGKTLEQVVKEQCENQGIPEVDSYDRAFLAARISRLNDFESAAFAKKIEKD